MIAGLPQEGAVRLVRHMRMVRRVIDCEVAEVLRQFLRLRQVGDVPQRDTALAVLAARLVVDDQDVAGELGSLDVHHLHALADQRVLIGADEPDLFRVLQVRDVDDVDATIRPVALRGRHSAPPSGR